ncbi:hypothetical protein BA195_07555 [Tenacibaculum soleae]|uniref:C2H2-type domain-containing protein n=1 Tax=Tenacibaculum soleae TaxID=447689 RepID=A0A1B9XZ12_9FLAO|nr:hypothetical protein [Tenacibaculum soleae]OCK42759.1 hypothetical protein BA195_07555 [Tenacibaculum soleae]
MKKFIPIFVLIIVCFSSCKTAEKKASTPTHPLNLPFNERPVPTLPNVSNVSVNVIGGAHYICPKKCKGGTSNVKGTACTVCKTPLAHNQAFHNTPQAPSSPVSTPVAPLPASGPNAAGQYHYTCNNGCAGGADAAGKCKSCASDLAHNAAFHS